jgi:hypothetical protein
MLSNSRMSLATTRPPGFKSATQGVFLKTSSLPETSTWQRLAAESARQARFGPSVRVRRPCSSDLEALDGILAFILNLVAQPPVSKLTDFRRCRSVVFCGRRMISWRRVAK